MPRCLMLRSMKLYNYFRSSASFRVRIALEIKGLSYEYLPVHLVKGEQHAPAYAQRQGDALVPALETDDGHLLAQSMAIIEYLEETHAAPPLLPPDALARARVRALAQMVACEIHPLNNLRVLQYLRGPLALPEAQVLDWYRHWCREGLAQLEAELQSASAQGPYAGGASPGLVDCFLVPQLFNARRFGVELGAFPRALAIEQACLALPAFQRAQPSRQADAE